MTYDPFMRIKNITAKDPAQNTILNYQYAYDKMDNIIDKTTEHGDYHYLYDDLYRLISSDNPESQAIIDENFAYDPAGNRVTSKTTDIYSYTGNNELNAYDDTTCEYDANGNLIKKIVGSIVTGYVYNIEDRLTEIWSGEPETGTLTARYYYDPFGRRLWKEVSGVRNYFHYSDEGLTGEYDADGNEIKAYGYKPGSTWTTDPLFMKVGTEYYFYHNDHLGTPQKMTGVNGAVVWSAKYSSFGEADVDASSTITNNLRFSGQYFDGESGLCYNYWRYYDPELGRYLRSDPLDFTSIIIRHLTLQIFYRLSNNKTTSFFIFSTQLINKTLSKPIELNFYLYTKNNPLNYVDPLGLASINVDKWVSKLERCEDCSEAINYSGGDEWDAFIRCRKCCKGLLRRSFYSITPCEQACVELWKDKHGK